MTDIRMSQMAGIPFGDNAGRPSNPGTGQPYFNGQENRLEVYTQVVGWQNIVAETPGVVSFTGTLLESNSTNTLVISGTNFTTGAVASLIGNDGTEYTANTTTVNSAVQITAVFPAVSASKEPYDIKVVNPSNLYGLLPDAVTVNDSPSWTTSAGSLGSFDEGSSVSLVVAATDEENNTITYSSSNLPAWLTLNSSTGALTGTAPSISSSTTYSFIISASDGINTATSRSFSITINSIVSWVTASGSIGTIGDLSRNGYTFTLSAIALSNTVSYTVSSGSLPSGLSLNSSTGVISGNASAVVSNTTSSFTINASDGSASASRSFSLTVLAPQFQSFSGSGSWTSPITGTVRATLLGAGGGGSTGNQQWATGAGGGGYLVATYSVIAGNSYSYNVGSAGNGQTVCDNSYWAVLGKGGDTSFATMIAGGGYGGDSHHDGIGANAAQGGTNTTTGALSVSKNYSGGNGGINSDNMNNFGGSNGLKNGENDSTYGSGAAGVNNGSAGTHAAGNGNGGAGGPSCQGGAHRGGGNGSDGILSLVW